MTRQAWLTLLVVAATLLTLARDLVAPPTAAMSGVILLFIGGVVTRASTPEQLETLMAARLYGSGLRLQGCLELRVKDLDFERGEILVRRGRGERTG